MTRLKLRDDAYYVATGDGICILTNHGEVVMTGPSIFQWVDRLAPHLDGRHTLEELTAGLPADRRTMAERVITALRDRGVVVEAGHDVRAHALTDDERRLYRREIGFLGYFGPSAERGFLAYRDSIAVLAGAGRILVETLESALRSGSRTVRVAVTGECPTDMAVLADCERRGRGRDPRQRIVRIAADLDDEDHVAGVLDGADIVVYAADRAAFDRARLLDRACAHAGVPFVSAMLVGGQAWLGPFGPAPRRWTGWTSAWRRLLALNGADHDGPNVQQNDQWTGAAPAVAANQLIREVVRRLSGTAEQTGQARMTQIDLRSLHTASQPFVPHPFSSAASCEDRAGLLATVGRLREGARLGAEEFSRQVAACLHPRLGVLGEVTERDFAQSPLAVSQVQVSDPVLLLGPGLPLPTVIGAGLSLAEARHAAVLRGLAVYGSLMVDPRRLHVRAGTARRTGDPGDPGEDLAALRAGEWSGFVWGHGLADEQPISLPAEAVFPALCNLRTSYAPPPGAAAGYDWHEAVRTGLIGQCRRLTLTEVVDCRHPFTPIEWNEVATDARGSRYRSIVQIIGGRLDVYDVTGSARVPTLAFCLDGITVAYASGFSFGEALRDGLAQVLLYRQAEANREFGYSPARVPALPARGRLPRLAACPAWSTDAAAVAARLAQLGWAAIAVPLDHDPGLTASIMPYLVNVVVTHG